MKPLLNGKQREGGTFFNKIINRRLTKMEKVISESDWRGYEGSGKFTKDLKIKKKEILQVYDDEINLTFGEVEWQVKLDVLRDDMYHNANILSKFFKGKILPEYRIKDEAE